MSTVLSKIQRSATRVWIEGNDVLALCGRPPVPVISPLSLTLDARGLIVEDIILHTLGRADRLPAHLTPWEVVLHKPGTPNPYQIQSIGRGSIKMIWNTFIQEARKILEPEAWALTNVERIGTLTSTTYNAYRTRRARKYQKKYGLAIAYLCCICGTTPTKLARACCGNNQKLQSRWFKLMKRFPIGRHTGWDPGKVDDAALTIVRRTGKTCHKLQTINQFRLVMAAIRGGYKSLKACIEDGDAFLSDYRKWRIGSLYKLKKLLPELAVTLKLSKKRPKQLMKVLSATRLREALSASKQVNFPPVENGHHMSTFKRGDYEYQLLLTNRRVLAVELSWWDWSVRQPVIAIRKRGKLVAGVRLASTDIFGVVIIDDSNKGYFNLYGNYGSRKKNNGMVAGARAALKAWGIPKRTDIPVDHRQYV